MNRFKHTVFAALLVAAIFLMAPHAIGQTLTTGDAVGIVADSTGAVVPGASVTLKATDTGETRTVTTNEQGEYRFPLLKPGEYIISATSRGMKSNNSRVTLLVGQEQAVNITLTPEGTSTVVEVTTEAALLQTENANIETSFNTKQVQDLPMPGGDLTTLAMTTPGIRVSVTGGSGNMNANGIPGSSVLFTLNGADEMDPYNNLNNSGASNNLLGANEVGEAAVVLNAYSSQYGRMAGGQVNLVGISGTNQFHGNAFYNYNWEGINANSFFNNKEGTPIGRSDAHNFGGRFGGPIIKNKVFAFFDDENLRYVLPGAGVQSVPSAALEAYTIAHVPAASLPLYQDYFNLINNAPGINRAVPVTNGSGPLQDGNNHLGCGTGTFTGTAAPGGGVFGVNVGCALAFGTNTNELNTEGLYTIRVDYNISNNHKIFFRFNNDHGVQATGVSPINPVFNDLSVQPQDTGNFNYTWVINPSLVNNLVGSAFWYQAQFGLGDFSKSLGLIPQSISIADGGANGGGFAEIGPAGGGIPNGRNIGHAQLNDDISWTHGAHTIKGGFAFRYDKLTYTSIAASSQTGVYSLNDLADFANGTLNSSGTNLGSSFSQSYPLYSALHFRIPSIDYYIQDEWAVTKSLKLTYGMRFETDFNPTCVEKCVSLFNTPFTSGQYQGGANVPYNQTIQTGLTNVFYKIVPVILEPRLGFAWKPGKGKTVFRGGIGIFSTNSTDSLAGTFSNQIPNKFSPSGLTFGNIGLAADPTSTAYIAQQSANAFFAGFGQGDTLAGIKAALGKVTFGIPSFSSQPAKWEPPHDIEWSFEIQQEITPRNIFDITYVGNHGYDIQETVNANQYTSAAGVTMYGGGYDGLPTAAPDPRFLQVTQYYNNGVSNYDGLTIAFRHTFSYGLQAQIHYTWSRALGTVGYENPFSVVPGYGNLNFDNRHQVAGDVLWTQPFKVQNKVGNALIKDWTVSGKMYLYSGSPFSVTDSKIEAQINSAGGIINPIADLLIPTATSQNCGSVAVNTACLQKSEFADYKANNPVTGNPIQADFGNTAPDQFYGPGYFDIDAQVMRDFKFKERASFTIGLNAYNVLNHPNFANPSGTLSSGSFGTITAVVGPPTSIYGSFQGASVSGRVVVLAGRFTF